MQGWVVLIYVICGWAECTSNPDSCNSAVILTSTFLGKIPPSDGPLRAIDFLCNCFPSGNYVSAQSLQGCYFTGPTAIASRFISGKTRRTDGALLDKEQFGYRNRRTDTEKKKELKLRLKAEKLGNILKGKDINDPKRLILQEQFDDADTYWKEVRDALMVKFEKLKKATEERNVVEMRLITLREHNRKITEHNDNNANNQRSNCARSWFL
ncbi:hypothetical protein BASA62_008281 [Batrachochytrium salamandrivorans]|nr:hypothetical protein BASA62_008281 [Batrachochytrium salamandrivorans]